ncbi:tRNA methyltransferase [Paraconexibacter sp. AEG42_29]|uniref:tRNA methyltransferase n=1 Tax=Paraconexibacter sp. AEG42_29 TaxID=2997339 RepID=A0AAU7AQL8_9ACTN
MSQLAFDERAGQELEELYRTRDAVRRRSLARSALRAAPGEHIIDVGCGPGFTTAELLLDIGVNGSVTGVDSSPQMLALAEARCAQHSNVQLHPGQATSLPAASGRFDGAICVQVLEYVPDIAAALAELHRVLRPGGRVVVWDIDWTTVSWHTTDTDRMRRALDAWDEHLTHPALPRTLASRMTQAGFDNVQMQAHPFAAAGPMDPDTYGAGISSLIRNFIAGRNGLSHHDAEDWAAEQRQLGERNEYYFACLQFCFTGTRR